MIQSVVKSIIEAKKIVFFTGAGVSTESGIPDFRSSKGLYNEKYYGYNPETILSHDFFFPILKSFTVSIMTILFMIMQNLMRFITVLQNLQE
jgi:NAD-dependent deacetylase